MLKLTCTHIETHEPIKRIQKQSESELVGMTAFRVIMNTH